MYRAETNLLHDLAYGKSFAREADLNSAGCCISKCRCTAVVDIAATMQKRACSYCTVDSGRAVRFNVRRSPWAPAVTERYARTARGLRGDVLKGSVPPVRVHCGYQTLHYQISDTSLCVARTVTHGLSRHDEEVVFDSIIGNAFWPVPCATPTTASSNPYSSETPTPGICHIASVTQVGTPTSATKGVGNAAVVGLTLRRYTILPCNVSVRRRL